MNERIFFLVNTLSISDTCTEELSLGPLGHSKSRHLFLAYISSFCARLFILCSSLSLTYSSTLISHFTGDYALASTASTIHIYTLCYLTFCYFFCGQIIQEWCRLTLSITPHSIPSPLLDISYLLLSSSILFPSQAFLKCLSSVFLDS